VTGLPPYYTKDQNELFNNILNNNLEFPERFCLSFEIKCLLGQLLEKDPSRRLGNIRGVEEIWLHPWLLGINESDVVAKRLSPPFKPNIFE
jgi:serine/threonine protein kinase